MEVKHYEKQIIPGRHRGWGPDADVLSLERLVESGMKRLFFLSVLLVCMLTVSASAAYIPEEVITENRDGRQLIIKTYTLSPADNPSTLIEEPFELEGFRYQHLDTTKEETSFSETKQHSETVTVTTDSDSLESILAQLPPTMEYEQDGYSGVLTLDHTGLVTSAAGYTTKYYTISDTREFTGLDRNDPSYVTKRYVNIVF